MKRILYTHVSISEKEIRIIITAHNATLYKTIEGVATKKFKSDRNIHSYLQNMGKQQVTKHGIVTTEKVNIAGYSNFHCLFTL